MSTASLTPLKKKCSYVHDGWDCWFPPEAGHNLCIFHLPMEQKQGREADFWRHLASYLTLLHGVSKINENYRLQDAHHEKLWFAQEFDPDLMDRYWVLIKPREPWRFTGFVFPAMDEKRNFRGFAFPKVDFRAAVLAGRVDFSEATFKAAADFEGSQFQGDASFRDVTFDEIALFFKARVNGDFDLSYAHVKYRLHFGGAEISRKARVRLWGLNLGQGSKDTAVGEVIFRDLPDRKEGGMSRVSFLHTVVYEDRPCFRFENVHWQEDPSVFLLDAELALKRKEDWLRLGVTEERREEMYQLFNIITEPGPDETQEQRRILAENSLYNLVRLDVERTAREIRRYYEDFGSYPDAGNYHIAEMEYRQRGTRSSKFFVKVLLWLYGRLSRYGESPGRAAVLLLAVLLSSTLVYPFFGFYFGTVKDEASVVKDCLVHLAPRSEPSQWWPTIVAFGKSFLFSLTNLAPGYFRSQSLSAASGLTTAISMAQAVLGIVLLTLLLLAVRRRFRR